MSTNTGHDSTQVDGTWMLNEPEKLIDFGHRALHLTTQAAKKVVRAYYEQESHHSYYAGCSTGGRQGLNAARRYPNDYDGILVGSAIPSQTHTSAWQIYVAVLQYPDTSAAYIPATMWTTIHQAVLDQCDLNDGVQDGMIMDPGACHFDSSVLLCDQSNSNSSLCLSSAQRANLERMYAPWLSNNGTLISPGISLSGEASFSLLMNSAEPQFGPSFYRYAVFNDSTWDWRGMSPDVVALAASINPGGMDVNPNLHEFREGGGKLMQYHGYSDPLIPSMNMPVWYDQVKNALGQEGADSNVADFYRIFMVPDMGHCGGGDGAWVLDAASQGGVTPKDNDSEHSVLWSLVDLVARDKEPSVVVGTKFINDTAADGVNFTRPICQWPEVAKYVGGAVGESGSWNCSS